MGKMQRRSPRLLARDLIKPKAQPKKYLPRRSQRLMKKKREVLTTYSRQRLTVLDSLPVDVIKYNIFPLLDYQTRLNMNLCLPAWDRVQTRMPPESVIKHQKDYCVKSVAFLY